MGSYNILNERGREMCNGKVNRKRNKVMTDGNRGQERERMKQKRRSEGE